MAFKIQEFIAQMDNKGISHKSDFEVTIIFPRSVDAIFSTRELSLRANRTDFPGRSIQTTPARHTIGPERQLAYNVSHIPITMTFICDAKMNIKRMLEEWQDIAIGSFRLARNSFNNTGVFNIGYYDDYRSTIIITQFERAGSDKPVYSCELQEAYPITINSLDADWSSDGIHELNVTWTYRYYTLKDIARPSSALYINPNPAPTLIG